MTRGTMNDTARGAHLRLTINNAYLLKQWTDFMMLCNNHTRLNANDCRNDAQKSRIKYKVSVTIT